MKLARSQFGPLVGAALALLPASLPGQQTQTYSGTFQVLWGDPDDASLPPQMLYTLQQADGSVVVLEMTESDFRPVGGPMELNRTAVQVVGAPVAPHQRPSPSPLLQHAPRVEVASMRREGLESQLQLQRSLFLGAPAPVSRPYITILCRFSDSTGDPPRPVSHFESLMGKSYPGVNHYWSEVTDQQINLDGSKVAGWYKLPQPRSYYVGDGTFGADLQKLKNDCAAAADADVYFPEFFGVNFQFDQRLDCCSWGGGGFLNLDGVSKLYAMTWEADWAMTALGTYAHEVGHSLGLPHSGGPYGRTYDSRWDVMSRSSWFRPAGSDVSLGTQTVAYHKDLLRVIPDARKVTATGPRTTVLLERSALPRSNSNARMIVVPLPTAPDQYYTVEARVPTGYDAPLPAGVVIHRVYRYRGEPAQVVDVDGNSNPNDAGATWTPGEAFVDRENGIRIAVSSREGDAFSVTVENGGAVAARLDRGGVSRAVAFGSEAPLRDSALVRLSGPAASGMTWRARSSARVQVETPSGRDGSPVRWSRHTRQLGAGTYVDTIVVEPPAPAVPALFVDTLRILEGTGLTAGLSQARSEARVGPGRWSRLDSVLVRLSGPGADTTRWVARRGATWQRFGLPTGSGGISSTNADSIVGRGSTAIRWWRAVHTGTTPGRFGSQIEVVVQGASGSPAVMADTVEVLAPLATSLTPSTRNRTLPQGARGASDSLVVQLQGPWAAEAKWNAYPVRWWEANRFLRIVGGRSPTMQQGTGDGVVRIERDASRMTPGVYVDTIMLWVQDTNNSTAFVDTLTVAGSSNALTLQAYSRRDSVVVGMMGSRDSVLVQVQGPDGSSTVWRATAKRERTTLLSANAFTAAGTGTGTGYLRWARNTEGLKAGITIDTLRVALTLVSGADTTRLNAELVDTLFVLDPPTLSGGAPHRHFAVVPPGGTGTVADSAEVRLQGYGAESLRWQATKRASWLELEVESGTGSGMVRWRRRPHGVSAGIHVDTLRITAEGAVGPALLVVDSLVVAIPLTIGSDSVRPAALVGVEYRDTLPASGGLGPAVWELTEGELPAGLALDSAGAVGGTPTREGSYHFTVRARSSIFTARQTFRLRVEVPLVITTDSVRPPAVMGASYTDSLRSSGGSEDRRWRLREGELPPGLAVDSLSGVVSGVPEKPGQFQFRVDARSGAQTASRAFSLVVGKPDLKAEAVLEQLLGGSGLGTDHVRFLDLLGNRNGRVDVGDVRAWLMDSGAVSGSTSPAMQELMQLVSPAAPPASTPESSLQRQGDVR